MKIIISIIVLILTLVLFNGCDKETWDTETENDKTFITGTENCCIGITTLDSTIKIIAQFPYESSFSFDIDNDGISDFEFHSDHVTSLGGANWQKSSIEILNSSFQISTTDVFDTLNRCTQVINDTITNYVFYNNYSSYTCPEDGLDTVLSTNIFSYPKIYSMGDRIADNEQWTNEDLTFSYYDQSHGWDAGSTSFSVIRGNWNNQNMKYILFRKEFDNRSLYGWLRLSIDNYKEIRVYEYAIQKEIFK